MICDELPDNLRKICNGTADMPLKKINAYRDHWGLEPLDGEVDEFDFFIHSGKADIPIPKTKIKTQFKKPHVKSCSSCTKPAVPKQRPIYKLGVGGELSLLFKAYGVPYCQACKDLARAMDEYGPEKCREDIDKIVDNILPRAREWVDKEYSWAILIFPSVKDFEIKRRIKNLVLTAITTFERKEKLRNTVFLPLKSGKILCSKEDVINECDVIVKSFKRFECLIRFVESVWANYPGMTIIVADDSLKDGEEYPETVLDLIKNPLIKWIQLPFDSGLSVGRNECVKLVTKKYTLLCDDDYIIDGDSNLEKMLSVLKSDSKVSLVGGLIEEDDVVKNWAGNYKISNKVLQMEKLNHKFRVGGGVEYKYADIVINFFIAKTQSLLKSPWSPEMKISSEHLDFFINRKNKGEVSAFTQECKVSSSKQLAVDHDYHKYRSRIMEFKNLLKKRHGLIDVKTYNFFREDFK